MIRSTWSRSIVVAFGFAAVTAAGIAGGQSEPPHKPGASAMQGGMMGMMQACPMMRGHGMPHLPAGNEKIELQMHADMMRAIADVLGKYAARLPDEK